MKGAEEGRTYGMTRNAGWRVGICAALAVATLAVFGPVLHHDFISYDDDVYVTENPHVQDGLTVRIGHDMRSPEGGRSQVTPDLNGGFFPRLPRHFR